ncbi:MAG: HNH endonuclease signature motif containing protein [Chloroflexi bacterium]|nr:HNH endonuclease signature motif containing protein [Chloroflexota bacterium]
MSPVAERLVGQRLPGDEYGALFEHTWVTVRDDLPTRSDIDKLPPYTTHKHTLFGQQEGRCGGCRMDFPFKLYEVDHIVPKSKGGTDSLDNLQLLCGHCNKVKGNRSQAHLASQLSKLGYV